MIFAIPMKLPSAANLREHWRTRANRVKAQRNAVALAMKTRRAALLEMYAALARGHELHIILLRVSARLLDDDNLGGAFKAVRDEVAKQLGAHDGPKGPLRFETKQEQLSGKGGLVIVRIEPIALAEATQEGAGIAALPSPVQKRSAPNPIRAALAEDAKILASMAKRGDSTALVVGGSGGVNFEVKR